MIEMTNSILWFREQEDGAKVVRVENLNNPYENQIYFDKRFKLTLNKLYAWTLVEYDRVVMLDADNLFLQKTDELFQCGQFCAVFINPCIFHTGLFVLQVKSNWPFCLFQIRSWKEVKWEHHHLNQKQTISLKLSSELIWWFKLWQV